jgi:N-acyl-D-aspartate/D-glutamate deacylase
VYDLLIKNGTLYDGTGAPARVADIAIQDGQIAEIGRLEAVGRQVIDADGHIVTPGFVDIHTHYDGQAIWDPVLDPSFSCGITTAILGNCGVGFAPVRPGQQERLVELMEGVEEIPGTALHAGLDFAWRSFDEFLDLLDSKPHSFDLGALLPHGPLRLYVMGDKVGTDKCASGAEWTCPALVERH